MSSTAIVPTNERAQAVDAQIRELRVNLVDNFLHLGELLSEAKENNYAEALGYDNFAHWLEESGVDMSERQAYYLIKIINNARGLGISREELAGAKMSKLKEIFTLDPETQGDKIKQLVADSGSLKLDDIRERVHQARHADGQERLTWRNFKVSESQAETIDAAVERAKRELGTIIEHDTGEVIEPTDGRALEMMAADFLANPDPNLAAIEAIPDESL
jgi:uncharacterized protein with ParB-like and HNH nuclease domain